MKFSSDFALLDVTKGRHKLATHLKKHGPVKVLIEAEIEYPFGHDDGTSIEFVCKVNRLEISSDH